MIVNQLTEKDVKKRLKKINITLKSKYTRSNKKIFYKCNICNYSTKATAYYVWNKGCLNCRKIFSKKNNKKIQIQQKGSLADHPYLVNEYDKSNPLKPDQIPNTSRDKLKWICSKCGHKWKAALRIRLKPSNKNQKYRNCEKCAHKISGNNLAISLIKKRGSLKDMSPEIMKEWDYKKNEIKPENISPYSSKKVWWLCSKGHSWEAKPSNRLIGKTNCPDCNNFKTSRAEIRIYSELVNIINNVKWSFYLEKRQLDIYLPNQKIAFEIDGHYHSNKEKSDIKKNIFFKKRNINIIRLRDVGLKSKLSSLDFFVDTSEIKINDLQKIYKILLNTKLLNKKETFEVKKRLLKNNFFNDEEYRRICSFLPGPPPEKSFEILKPEISLEWDYKKNFPLQPSMFTTGSNQKVSWLCSNCGKSFTQSILNRTNGQGCKQCGNKRGVIKRVKKIIKEKGSLKKKFPILTKEFLEFENKIKAENVPITSKMYAWWFCEKHNHKWQASVYDRTIGERHNCSLCYRENQSEITRLAKFNKKNSFQKKFPIIFSHILKDKIKNIDLKTITYGSKVKLWFKCSNKHIFQSKPNNQTSDKKDKLKCRDCYDQRVKFEVNNIILGK